MAVMVNFILNSNHKIITPMFEDAMDMEKNARTHSGERVKVIDSHAL